TIAGDRALQRGVEGLDAEARTFTANLAPDTPPTSAELAALDGKIVSRLVRPGLGPVLKTVEYRALAAGDGRIVRFAGLDGLHRVTRLLDGRWPTRCDAQRCEVVAVVPDSPKPQPVAQLPANSALGLTIVGTAVATSDLVLSGELRPDASEQILLADGVSAASNVPVLALFRRTYAWQVPVDYTRLRSIDVGPLLAGVRSLTNDPSMSGLFVSGPEDQLRSITSRTRITDNRLAVPVGALLVLFFGVAVLAGLGGRVDHQRAVSVLRRRGADRLAIVCFGALEALLPVLGGVVLGLATALPIGSWLGHRADLGGWSVLRRSIDGSVDQRVLGVSLVAFLLIFAVLSINDGSHSVRGRRLLASDVAGVAAFLVLLVLVGRGSVSTSSLNRVVDPSLVAVPVLSAVALAAVVVRVVPLVLRATSNASPRRWPLTKLTLAEATAQPLRSIATASLIAVTVMFSLLTFGYASTLRLGSSDQAAFAVPYDFRLQLGAPLVRPQALTPSGGWASLAPGTTATDVLRRGVSVQMSATTSQTVELIGLNPTTLASLHGWRASFGSDPQVMAKAIDQPRPGALGTSLPSDAVSIEFDGSGLEGLHTSAVIDRVDGTWHELTLDEEFPGGVRTKLTPGDAGGLLVGLRLAQPADVSARIEHHVGEGNTSAEARPVEVVLHAVKTSASGGHSTTIELPGARLHAANATVDVQTDSALKITGSLLGVAILVAPSGPGQQDPVNVIVDPATAATARGGIIVVDTASGSIRVRPVAVASRFPGVGTRFMVADVDTLQPALDLLQPGAGTANELWLASDSATHEQALAAQLDKSGFSEIQVDRRSSRQAALATDPLSVVTLLVLTSSALVAIVLGGCAVLFGAAADAADDRPLLRMLALERVDGRRLVTMVAGKTLAVILLSIPLGLAAGRWLLRIATRLVAVSATSGQPDPALRLSVPWATVVPLSIGLLLLLAGGAVVGALSARRVPHEDLMRGTT
ncbi:MAG: hypothetical protein ACXV8K_17570, partial [Ilumatobacteraceae bacterium]